MNEVSPMRSKRSIMIITFITWVVLLFAVAMSDAYHEGVYEAQKKLKELGYNPGSLDGLWGKKTREAVRQFQKDMKLPVTGRLDQKTTEKLGIEEIDLCSVCGASAVFWCPVRKAWFCDRHAERVSTPSGDYRWRCP